MKSSFTFKDFDGFDAHINNSIPTLSQLDVIVQRVCYDMAQENTYVVDLGCSTGRVLRAMPKRDNVEYLGIDRDMENEDQPADAVLAMGDITDYDIPDSSVIICMFTLQFLPPHQRQAMLDKMYASLVRGGVLIIAEKTHADNPRIDVINQTALMQHKAHSFTAEEIVSKQIGISPIMHLRTESELFKELDDYHSITTIWAWGGFRALVAVKE